MINQTKKIILLGIFFFLFFNLEPLEAKSKQEKQCTETQIINIDSSCKVLFDTYVFDPIENSCKNIKVRKPIINIDDNIIKKLTYSKNVPEECISKRKLEFTEDLFGPQTTALYEFGDFDTFFLQIPEEIKIEKNKLADAMLTISLGFDGYLEEQFFDKTISIHLSVNNITNQENIAFEHFLNGSELYLNIPYDGTIEKGQYTINIELNPNGIAHETDKNNNSVNIPLEITDESLIDIPKDPVESIEEFNQKGTFKLRPGFPPEAVQELSVLQDQLLQIPSFNKCTKDIYAIVSNSPCNGGPQNIACVQPDPSTGNWLQLNDELVNGTTQFDLHHVVWHELIHVCDFSILSSDGGNPTTQRQNIVRSIGWEHSFAQDFQENQGYEEPFLRYPQNKYGYTNSHEDLAVAQESLNPISSSPATASSQDKHIRCRIIRDIFFGGNLGNLGEIDCGNQQTLNLSDFDSQRLNKSGTEFINSGTPFPYIASKNYDFPKSIIESFENFSYETPENKHIDRINLPTGLYNLKIKGYTYNNVVITKSDSQENLIFFYDYNINGQQDTSNDIPYSVNKERVKTIKHSDISEKQISTGWNWINGKEDFFSKTYIEDAKTLFQFLKNNGIDVEYIVGRGKNKSLIYYEKGGYESHNFKLHTEELLIFSNNNSNIYGISS